MVSLKIPIKFYSEKLLVGNFLSLAPYFRHMRDAAERPSTADLLIRRLIGNDSAKTANYCENRANHCAERTTLLRLCAVSPIGNKLRIFRIRACPHFRASQLK